MYVFFAYMGLGFFYAPKRQSYYFNKRKGNIMDFWHFSRNRVLEEVKSTEQGLSSAEAEKRLTESGTNKLVEAKKETLLHRFIKQLIDPMVLVLIAAAVISAITAKATGDSMADVFIIMFVVVLNTILGVVQESKAEAALEALKKMSAATSHVLRDGQVRVIKSEDLVVGDIVLLEAGDAVPADGRILECASLKIEESALTGESVPVEKTDDTIRGEDETPLGDRKNMIYMGSSVVYGRGKAVITGTGMNTEMGKIADAINQAEDSATPLQQKLNQLSKILTILVLVICVVMFAVGMLKAGEFTLDSILPTFMLAVSLAVAAIPEGLVAVVTIVLSIGVTKMSKRNAIVRRLTAVETLGCTQIICSDKTGTLTQNKMTVVDHYGEDKLLATAMTLCSDAEPDETEEAVGEPTECALVNYATKLGLKKPALKNKYPRVGEAPFDSMRKMMSTVHERVNGFVQYTKGAPDEVLKCCTKVFIDGKVEEMTSARRAEILAQNTSFASQALRVLAAAYREYDEKPTDFRPDALEQDLIFIGLCGMIDPIRPEVKDAVALCAAAGIRPVMITGDHRDTAVAIAKSLGILTDPSEAITGADLNKLSDEELNANITKYSVYARVQPEHKVRIVNAWRNQGKITAMTGDGVNDAPSIKNADIGIGMGITGTDVTKNVADMILADDNFATIVSAVEEGRRVYDNIRKAIHFLLSSNLSEVLTLFITTLILGAVHPILEPIHLLFINLITDSLPALALGLEKGEPNIMKRKPRDQKDGIFSNGVGAAVIYQGVMVTALTLIAYWLGYSGVLELGSVEDKFMAGTTMAFLTMSMAEIFHAYNMRSQFHSIFKLKTHNIALFGAMIFSLLLSTAVIAIPALRTLFHFEAITVAEYVVALGLAFLVIPIVEIVKAITSAVKKNKD